jgi:hypothetical protein
MRVRAEGEVVDDRAAEVLVIGVVASRGSSCGANVR